jgi:hypothetical protein
MASEFVKKVLLSALNRTTATLASFLNSLVMLVVLLRHLDTFFVECPRSQSCHPSRQ